MSNIARRHEANQESAEGRLVKILVRFDGCGVVYDERLPCAIDSTGHACCHL